MKKIISPEKISIKIHPELSEKIIQSKIADDPGILGLGDLVLKDKERLQPRAGRLDLLMQDLDTNRRYEIEIQLGKTDESHIIRTIEYWDMERKRYPQYDHCAVIIAEEITSRFFNVISLFNGSIPLIAIQMSAYKFGDDIALIFSKILDETSRGLVEEDEEVQEITDRNYWLSRATDATVKMADQLLEIINTIELGFLLKYNKYYIGLAKDNQPNNFAIFRPKKNYLTLEVRLPKSAEIDKIIESSGIEMMGYDNAWGKYRLRLSKDDIAKYEPVLKDLLTKACYN